MTFCVCDGVDSCLSVVVVVVQHEGCCWVLLLVTGFTLDWTVDDVVTLLAVALTTLDIVNMSFYYFY